MDDMLSKIGSNSEKMRGNMDDVRIADLDNGKVALFAPFNDELPSEARAIGGKPARKDGKFKYWVFDARDKERVKELALRFYGTTGSLEESADRVTVRVHLRPFERHQTPSAMFAGRKIAWRPARDADVRLADGVVLVEGELGGSGGSMRFPQIDADDDVIVEIRDLPRGALGVENPEHFTIVDQQVDIPTLRDRRESLLAELKEIDAALASAGKEIP
ncbi:hypothetical protein [Streptomyces cucumeris]|uniref:hypothetical protein n=1 Tax=Streptomyces cucumeris TaxID=2962890 RepID=UPI0020C91F56|nr:hypothetical protein [Streptomyces sp. NEAU-Y11]MCP9209585.1 hypothetical protein [Streptomyces sp. NEAU-Y11]